MSVHIRKIGRLQQLCAHDDVCNACNRQAKSLIQSCRQAGRVTQCCIPVAVTQKVICTVSSIQLWLECAAMGGPDFIVLHATA